MPAVVAVIIVAAAIVFAVLVVSAETVLNRAKDRRRTRARQLPFAGRAEIHSTWPSLVAPQLWEAVRDFQAPWLIRNSPEYHSRRYPRGVLTVAFRGESTELAWEPDAKSRRRGARSWRLDKVDIEQVRFRSMLDRTAEVTVVILDQSFVRMEIASPSDLRSALARTSIMIYEGTPKDADRTDSPTLPAPSRRRSRGEDRATYARRMIAESDARRADVDHTIEEWARRRLAAVPPLDARTRTWNDVADFLAMTPAQARQVLKDLSPDELARLGLRGDQSSLP